MPIKSQQVSKTGTGYSAPVRFDSAQVEPLKPLVAVFAENGMTYTVEVCFNKAQALNGGGDDAGGDWFPVDDFNGISASQYRRLQIPMTAIRLNVTAGPNSVRMVVNQEF